MASLIPEVKQQRVYYSFYQRACLWNVLTHSNEGLYILHELINLCLCIVYFNMLMNVVYNETFHGYRAHTLSIFTTDGIFRIITESQVIKFHSSKNKNSLCLACTVWLYICVCICMYVCMYVCMDVCTYICIYAMCICMYACMYVCTYVCMYVHGVAFLDKVLESFNNSHMSKWRDIFRRFATEIGLARK